MLLTDRSRYERGTKGCQRARYWAYEFDGSGLKLKSESLPLVTGTHVHEAIAEILDWSMGLDHAYPPREWVREMLAEVVAKYRAECADGFQEEDIGEQAAYVIEEQACLVQGLVWAFYRCVLPWLLQEFEILAVEQEIDLPVDCTCGLGSNVGSFKDHEERTCDGVGIMVRPDVVLRRKSDGQLGTADFKTSAWSGEVRDVDHLVQMVLAGVAAEKQFGEPATYHYLLGLYKGQRKADKGEKLKRQQSSACYLYYRPADPPFGEETYHAEWTRARGFGRVPVWECFSGLEMAPVEHWVMDRMSAEEAGNLVGITGPLQRQTYLDKEVLEEVVTEELDVRQRMTFLEMGDLTLGQAFRRSWDCFEFSKPCEFLPLCLKQAGWDAPLQVGRYERRVPHHAQEVEQKKEAENA